MRQLAIGRPNQTLSILCFGAHSDDIEIGAGGTLLSLVAAKADVHVHWCVLSGRAGREKESWASALAFLGGTASRSIELADFDDSYFPSQSERIKKWMGEVRSRSTPDVIFTHRRDDAHQDHREIHALTWNLFRDHLILEYEIPKWDGDLGQPNFYMPLSREVMDRKTALLLRHFGTQRGKDWFDAETFTGLARLRGMECRSAEGYAEAFYIRKACLAVA